MNYESYMYQQPVDPVREALLLAMTQNLEQEKEMIRELQNRGFKAAATMVSGYNYTLMPKLVNSVIGVCLNADIIEKKTAHIHPVVHALHEATESARLVREISQNCCLKITVVRYNELFALGIYGDMAIHELSAHKTIGIGFQILGE